MSTIYDIYQQESVEYKSECPYCKEKTAEIERLKAENNRIAELALDHHEKYVETIGKLQKELAAEKEKHRWIPTSERLPEDEESVYVWNGKSVLSAYREMEEWFLDVFSVLCSQCYSLDGKKRSPTTGGKSMTDKLKPCPFCGQIPKIWDMDAIKDFVYCSNQGCEMYKRSLHRQVWQKRPVEDKLREMYMQKPPAESDK